MLGAQGLGFGAWVHVGLDFGHSVALEVPWKIFAWAKRRRVHRAPLVAAGPACDELASALWQRLDQDRTVQLRRVRV